MHRQRQLPGVVEALRSSGRLSGRLDGGQQESAQRGDDRDHDQQFHQRKSATLHALAPQNRFFDSSKY
jgi:hypothetical protein